MSALSVGWYNPKSRMITNIEPWEDKPENIAFTSCLLAQQYQLGDGKRLMPSSIWIAFDMFKTLRIFTLNDTMPKPQDCDRILALVMDMRKGGGVERVF